MANSKVTTQQCKEAIVLYVAQNKASLEKEFVPPESMDPALLTKNWKRTYKIKDGNLIERTFDCKPYEDQLRGYTYDDGIRIVKVTVQGE